MLCDIPDSRHLSTRFAAGEMNILVHNFYVPAGGDEPDPEINPKFRHKLDFVAEMRVAPRRMGSSGCLDPGRRSQHRAARARCLVAQAASQRGQPHAGRDDELRGDAQRRRLGRPDAPIVPADQKLYTWWSYRARDWALSDRGRRLDHIWSSANLSGRLTGIEILRAARGWDRPSDHVPVIARFDLE